MLLFMREVVFNDLMQIADGLSRDQFSRKHIVQSRNTFCLISRRVTL